ncbi:MAG: PKD domain-containing protein [Fibrobacterota bacterium]
MIARIVLVSLAICFSVHAVAPYGLEELTFTGGSHAKPYWDVEFSADFIGPNGESFTLHGFWYEGTTWKIRFSPLSTGTWSYTTSSNDALLNGQSGTVNCSGTQGKGWMVVNPDIPHAFKWSGSGEPYHLTGDCWWGHLASGTTSEKFPYSNYTYCVDLWAAAGYNYAYCMLSSWYPAVTDWFNEGGKPWEESSGKFDLTRMKSGYFKEVDRRIAYADANGICLCLTLTESKGQISDINIYKKFGRYTLARWGAYNVSIWLVGEYDDSEGDPFTVSDWDEIGNYLQQNNPYDHPISLHCLNSTSGDFGNKAWHDYIVQQHDHTNSTMVRDFDYGKPVLSSEWYMGWSSWSKSPEDEMRFAWENMVGGGYVCSGHPRVVYANDLGWSSPHSNSTTYLGYVAVMRDIMTEIERFDEREPCNNLVSGGYGCRIGIEEFIIYRTSQGASTLNLSGFSGAFSVDAYNLRTGTKSARSSVTGGSSVSVSTPSSGNEWLIRVYKEASNQAPSAVISVDTENGDAPLTVNFTGSGSADPDGSIVSYYWDFDDGENSSQDNPSHQFSAGEYNVMLAVTDDLGAADTAYRQITVLDPNANKPPQASFIETTADENFQSLPYTVNFDASGSSDQDGSIVSYYWEFGDGEAYGPSSQTSVDHDYNSWGQFQIMMIATDDSGATDTAYNNINHYNPNELEVILEFYHGDNETPVVVKDGFVEDCGQTIDRSDTYSNIPASLSGCTYLKTARDDKSDAADENEVYYEVSTNYQCTVFVPCQASVALPLWISEDEWSDANMNVNVGSHLHNIYYKVFSAGDLGLKRSTDRSAQGTGYIFKLSSGTSIVETHSSKQSGLPGIVVSPNPFNPTTVITIAGISVASIPELQIYDVHGRCVASSARWSLRVMDGLTTRPNAYAGTYTWDAAHMPAGVYTCRVLIGDRSFTKKITLLK